MPCQEIGPNVTTWNSEYNNMIRALQHQGLFHCTHTSYDAFLHFLNVFSFNASIDDLPGRPKGFRCSQNIALFCVHEIGGRCVYNAIAAIGKTTTDAECPKFAAKMLLNDYCRMAQDCKSRNFTAFLWSKVLLTDVCTSDVEQLQQVLPGVRLRLQMESRLRSEW